MEIHEPEDFQVRNLTIEKLLKEIGTTINRQMPPGFGFTLLIYTYDAGAMFYTSSGERNGMIKSLKELLNNLESKP